MYFAEFYQKPVGLGAEPRLDELIPGVGDRSVLILDGRQHFTSHHEHARQWAKQHGWPAYRLCKGKRFSSPERTTALRWVI